MRQITANEVTFLNAGGAQCTRHSSHFRQQFLSGNLPPFGAVLAFKTRENGYLIRSLSDCPQDLFGIVQISAGEPMGIARLPPNHRVAIRTMKADVKELSNRSPEIVNLRDSPVVNLAISLETNVIR